MFNGSYLSACMKLWIVQKIRFSLLESGQTEPWCSCGFLIHLYNRSDSPHFRAPWKKICQKYGTRQELSLFKDHPLSCQYGDALCSMVPTYGLCKKLDFPFLSLGGRIHGARVWCLSQVPKPRNHWQEVEGSGKK